MEILDLSLAEVFSGTVGIAAILSVFIEVSPIKINPWSRIAKSIGKAINADVLRELDEVKKEIDVIQKEIDVVKAEQKRQEEARKEDNATLWRKEVLRYNLELTRDIKHTREDFIEVLSTIDDYEDYCSTHPNYENTRAVHAIANIERVYDDRLAKGDFVQD